MTKEHKGVPAYLFYLGQTNHHPQKKLIPRQAVLGSFYCYWCFVLLFNANVKMMGVFLPYVFDAFYEHIHYEYYFLKALSFKVGVNNNLLGIKELALTEFELAHF